MGIYKQWGISTVGEQMWHPVQGNSGNERGPQYDAKWISGWAKGNWCWIAYHHYYKIVC